MVVLVTDFEEKVGIGTIVHKFVQVFNPEFTKVLFMQCTYMKVGFLYVLSDLNNLGTQEKYSF